MVDASRTGTGRRRSERDGLQEGRAVRERRSRSAIHLLDAPRGGKGRSRRLSEVRHETGAETLAGQSQNTLDVTLAAKKKQKQKRGATEV